ncbi:MAG: SpoIIE family protein phosphatase [Anaerolineales bacterium]
MQPLIVPGRLNFLEKIRKYTMQAAKAAGLEKARAYKLSLAVDEIATNIINYGYRQAGLEGLITIEADINEHALTITLDDTSGFFDPTLKPPPPPEYFNQPLEERQIGGWGVYLALQSVDEFYYHRSQDHNLNIFVMYKATHGDLLVIDSNKDSCTPISEHLLSLGYTVTCAENRHNALNLMQQQKFEVILVDLPMLDSKAEEFVRGMKADNALRSIPIILLADQDHIGEAEKCIEEGADDYVVLPFSQVVLEARVRAILDRQRVRTAEQNLKNTLNSNRELQIGHLIQHSFLPETLPQFPGWEIAAIFEPASEIMGDFYDSFILPNNTIGLVMGDVNNRGITAVLFMAIFRSLLRAYTQQTYEIQLHDQESTKDGQVEQLASLPMNMSALKNAIELTNNFVLTNHNSKKMIASIFFGILDPTSGILFYVNADHEPPLVISRGEVKETLVPSGSAIGMVPDAKFEIHQTQLDPGDTLLVYSNGLTETKNPNEEVFGSEGLYQIIEKTNLSPEDLLDQIASNLHIHIADGVQSDDIVMLALKHLD